MERKNIPFQYGIHRSPSTANDGELSECINLEVHNGELTPSVMPQLAFTLAEGDKLLFVHKSGNYKNYIIQRGSDICWFSDNDKDTVTTIMEITPTSIHSVGNTLIVLSEDHMEYILYKSNAYKPIGSKPPFCSISFGLRFSGHANYVSLLGSFTIESDANDTSDWFVGFKQGIRDYIDEGTDPKQVSYLYQLDEIKTDGLALGKTYVQAMTEGIMPGVNEFVASNRKFGRFMHPFYLRYAYRLYDGSHYMHSAPVLFPVNMEGPACTATGYKDEKHDFTCYFSIVMDALGLDFQVAGFYDENGNKVESDLIEEWEDIIKGLDVFVSSPIYPYNQDGYVTGYWGTDNIYGNSVMSTGSTNVYDLLAGFYGNYKYSTAFPKNTLAFTFEKNDDFLDLLESAGQFYKVYGFDGMKSLTANSTTGLRMLLPIKEDILSNLEQQEALEDDYDSHNAIIPSLAHVYNGRLNISGIRTKLFNGFPIESMVPYTYHPGETNHYWHIQTELEVEGKTVTVVAKNYIKLYEKPAFIYYPNTKATKFALFRYAGTNADPGFTLDTYYALWVSARAHKMLNGSFYLSPTFGVDDDYKLTTIAPKKSGDPYISYPNKIYTSEVNNPFYFPLSGRNSIGTGEIITITSNSKAVSPGQFGEYPLIVFSSDGVWAMQVNDEGLYYGTFPISKDICINPNVLQTDRPVFFVSDNGLHSIVGDAVENISAHVKGKPESFSVPAFGDGFTVLADTAADSSTFTQFIRSAIFAYDYANSRILAYSPGYNFAYVISMESGMVTKMVTLEDNNSIVMSSAVNAYPEIYMQSGSGIYTFVTDNDTTGDTYNGLLVTRPMAFADPLAYKAITDVRLLYRRTSAHSSCRYAMYVSNDGFRWIKRTSLRGHSFRYFRFVIFTTLADNDALQGMSVMYDYRRNHKLR